LALLILLFLQAQLLLLVLYTKQTKLTHNSVN
jgi:hypothetical protein